MQPTANLRRFSRFFAGALLIIVVGAFVPGLTAANIQGRLDYSNGTPAGALAVRLTATTGVPPPAYTAYSARNGMYYFSRIRAGAYLLEVLRNKVVVYHQSITVPEPGYSVPVIRLP